MNIKHIQIPNGIFLAPMAGVTDAAFRQICTDCGAEYVVTEMVSAKAVVYKDKKTRSIAKLGHGENPAAIQIFGSDPAAMSEAAGILTDLFEPSAIDINMGCPVPKIAGSGDGSALMREPLKAASIMESVVKSADIPVTVKIRKGWNDKEINAVQIAKIAEDCGISAVCVHGFDFLDFYGKTLNLFIDGIPLSKILVFANMSVLEPFILLLSCGG